MLRREDIAFFPSLLSSSPLTTSDGRRDSDWDWDWVTLFDSDGEETEEEEVVAVAEEEIEEEVEMDRGETSMNATGTSLFGQLNPGGRGLSEAWTLDCTRPP